MTSKQVIGGPLVIGGRTLSLSRAIRAGDFVFLTGQVPFKDGQVMTTGTIEDQTRAVLDDIKATLAEAGYPGIISENWYGLYAPAGTSKEVVARLYTELDRAIRSPDVREKLAQQGAEIRETTPDQAAAFVRGEIAKWAKVIKDSGAKVD